MGRTYHVWSQRYRKHLPHTVVMFRTMTHGADATMIGVTMREVVEAVAVVRVVGIEKDAGKFALIRTKVRPVSPVSLLT